MLNQTVLVGRLVKTPEIIETESGKKVTNITLAIPKPFKNSKGDYDTDFIKCTLWNGIAESTTEHCKKGDLIGVKGRLETSSFQKENGEKSTSMSVAVEKVTFLSSREKNVEQER